MSETETFGKIVAPLVGAWIETDSGGFQNLINYVAPLVGAWIETTCFIQEENALEVAPLVGAWIETLNVCESV